jgi:hypothetical protein
MFDLQETVSLVVFLVLLQSITAKLAFSFNGHLPVILFSIFK